MKRKIQSGWLACAVLGSIAVGCGGARTCDLDAESPCDDGFVCEAVANAEPACFPETVISGRVFNSESDAAIAGARVVALDATTGAAASDVIETGEDGTYRIRVALPRSADESADVKSGSYTLRVAAEGYQSFPSPIREALPITVTRADDPENLPDNTRDVSLLPITGADPAALGSIAGTVSGADGAVGGVLVVAEGGPQARSAITDSSGSYAILNLEAGTYTVSAYVAGSDFAPVPGVALGAGEDKADVDLAGAATAQLTTLSGGVNLVDAAGATAEPTVVLALASTGEVPRGLRSGTPAQRFEIAGIPPGTYDILASYNNDGLVVDPDPQQLPRPIRITLPTDAPGGTLDVGNFKITGAVDLVTPGGAEAATQSVPASGLTLEWVDDASEDFYGIELFDAFGARIWGSAPSTTERPAVEVPRNTASIAYAGPALTAGQTYQWRVTSYSCDTAQCGTIVPISRSENLRGIFTVSE